MEGDGSENADPEVEDSVDDGAKLPIVRLQRMQRIRRILVRKQQCLLVKL